MREPPRSESNPSPPAREAEETAASYQDDIVGSFAPSLPSISHISRVIDRDIPIRVPNRLLRGYFVSFYRLRTKNDLSFKITRSFWNIQTDFKNFHIFQINVF